MQVGATYMYVSLYVVEVFLKLVLHQYNSDEKAPPLTKKPPLLFEDLLTRGGAFSVFGRRPKIFKGFLHILLGKTDQKRFKNTIFKDKIAFEKLYFKKNRACGAATTQANFEFTGGYCALYKGTKHFLRCDRRAETRSYWMYGQLRRSLRMHKTFFALWLAR